MAVMRYLTPVVLEPKIIGDLGQDGGYWCPGSVCRQDISHHGIDSAE